MKAVFRENTEDVYAGNRRGLEKAIQSRRVTHELARQMLGATEVSTSSFGDEIIKGMAA